MRIGSKSRPPDYGNRGLTHTILDLRSVVCYLYEDAAHQLVVTSRLSGGCTFIIDGFRMRGLSPQPVFASTASNLHNLKERGLEGEESRERIRSALVQGCSYL